MCTCVDHKSFNEKLQKENGYKMKTLRCILTIKYGGDLNILYREKEPKQQTVAD